MVSKFARVTSLIRQLDSWSFEVISKCSLFQLLSHTLGLFSTFLFPATFRARKQSFRRSPWLNFCNKLGTFGQTLQSQRSASKDVVDEGARRIDLTRRGGTSPTLPPPLPLYHLVHHPSITITQTHYRHQSRSCAAL